MIAIPIVPWVVLFIGLLIHPPLPEAYQLSRVYGIKPSVAEAVAYIESREDYRPGRSKAGACGLMQTLGGRYGNSPCWLLELFPALSILEGAENLSYFRSNCGENWYLPAYNAGWINCCGGPYFRKRKDEEGRRWLCNDSYHQRVKRILKRGKR